MNVGLQPPARRTRKALLKTGTVLQQRRPRKALLVYSYWYVPYYTSLQQTAAVALIIINIIEGFLLPAVDPVSIINMGP